MPPPPHAHRSQSAVTRFIRPEEIDAILEPWVPDPEDRRFLTRCLVEEGPLHHRGANFVLLRLLGDLARALSPGPERAAPGPGLPVPMRLPPHLRPDGDDDAVYPIRLPVRAVERLAPRGSRDFDAIVDCLADGPPQHAVANVLMATVLDALLERAARR